MVLSSFGQIIVHMFFVNCVYVPRNMVLGYLLRVTPGLTHIANYVNKKMLLVLCLVGVLESWWIYDSILKPVLQKWLLCVCLFVHFSISFFLSYYLPCQGLTICFPALIWFHSENAFFMSECCWHRYDRLRLQELSKLKDVRNLYVVIFTGSPPPQCPTCPCGLRGLPS